MNFSKLFNKIKIINLPNSLKVMMLLSILLTILSKELGVKTQHLILFQKASKQISQFKKIN